MAEKSQATETIQVKLTEPRVINGKPHKAGAVLLEAPLPQGITADKVRLALSAGAAEILGLASQSSLKS